jgi:hypothetical protein
MNYPISLNFPDSRSGLETRSGLLPALNPPLNPPAEQSVNEAALIDALAIVVRFARANGQTLADLKLEVLADDVLLEPSQRRILSEVVAKAWEQFPV